MSCSVRGQGLQVIWPVVFFTVSMMKSISGVSVDVGSQGNRGVDFPAYFPDAADGVQGVFAVRTACFGNAPGPLPHWRIWTRRNPGSVPWSREGRWSRHRHEGFCTLRPGGCAMIWAMPIPAVRQALPDSCPASYCPCFQVPGFWHASFRLWLISSIAFRPYISVRGWH